MAEPRSHLQGGVGDCKRCGWRDRPGHGCSRRWMLPKWLKLGPFDPWGLRRSGFKRSDGTLSHTYWTLHWRWGKDVHSFLVHPSLGSHTNVSERSRREQYEREHPLEWPEDDDD